MPSIIREKENQSKGTSVLNPLENITSENNYSSRSYFEKNSNKQTDKKDPSALIKGEYTDRAKAHFTE
jgi:hypothetical protein